MSNIIERTADKMKHVYDANIDGAQWYFGSRTHDFYLFGVDELINELRSYEFIDVRSKAEGTLIRRGEPAITVTIRSHDMLHYGNMVETLLYNRIWYASTVGTILIMMRDVLAENGFGKYSVFPQIGRASVNEEQSRVAHEMFERIFYKTGDSLRPVATHNEILMTSEEYCLQNYSCVMSDTYDMKRFCELVNSIKYVGEIMVDSKPIIDNVEYVLRHTNNRVCQVESVTLSEWVNLVQHFSSSSRISFGIGSCCFTNVSRDTFGLVYKTCAVHRDGEWLGVSKKTVSKETISGYIEEL